MHEIASGYRPQPHQVRFHASGALEKLFLAGVGAGKTLCGVHEAVYLANDNRYCDGAIIAPTYPMLRDVILPLWEAWIPKCLYTHRKGDQYLIWHPTGRKIFLRSGDKPGRLSGLNLAWAWLDEAAQLRTPEAWKVLQARIRDPKAERRCLFTTTTPLGLNWLIREFRKVGIKRHIVRARTTDNAYLDEDFEAGLRASYGPEYAAQFLDALVLELAGAVWPYIPTIHTKLSHRDMLKRCVAFFGGVDWGFTNPACLLVAGVDSDGRWYLVDCWYMRGQDRDVIAHQAKIMNKRWNVIKWWSDHDPEGIGHMRSTTSEECEEDLRACDVDPAIKSVEQGVQHTRSLFPVRSDGSPRIHVSPVPELDAWRREVDGYYFPEESEEPDAQFGDHAMDATRYLTYSHSETWGSRAVAVGAVLPNDLTQSNPYAGM